MVPVPETHVSKGEISKSRYQCVICHVPQANAKPLVINENDMFVRPKSK